MSPAPTLASLVATGTAPAEWIGVRSDLLVALWAIADLSEKSYGFAPIMTYCLTTSIPGKTLPIPTGFVVYYDLPVWPAGSTYTTAAWAAEIGKMLGSSYTVGIGQVEVSVAKIA